MRSWAWSGISLALLLASCGSPPPQPAEPKPAPPRPPRITQFYGSPGVIARGDAASICYGVEDADKVRLDPPVEQLKPAMNRCFEVSPSTTTVYRLTAEGANGATVTQAFAIQVVAKKAPATAAAPAAGGLIEFFFAMPPETTAGRPINLCFSAPAAKKVTIAPAPEVQPTSSKGCAFVSPAQTTTYTLTASGETTESRKLTVRVR